MRIGKAAINPVRDYFKERDYLTDHWTFVYSIFHIQDFLETYLHAKIG